MNSLNPTIVYEDEAILTVNKPAGLIVHGDGKNTEKTLCDWLINLYPTVHGVGEPLETPLGVIDRPGIVHRLDKDTSGVMVIAKTQQAYEHLKQQFKDRNVEKKYHAFVYGNVSDDEGIIDRPIARSKSDFRLHSAQRFARGEYRLAVTYYRVFGRTKDVSFIEARPKTGRTHQIRVHCKAINHPVVADPLYAPKRPAFLDFKRLALHARSLSFTNLKGEYCTVTAPYPDDFKHAIGIFKEQATIVMPNPASN